MDWKNEKGLSPKGTMTWVSTSALQCEVRIYSHLFTVPELGAVDDWEALIDSKNSEKIYPHALVDQSVVHAKTHDTYQFERMGYFVVDQDTTAERKVFNQIVALKDATAPTMSRKEEQMRQLAEKQAKMNLRPQDMFKTAAYSAWDADGVPTHDGQGTALTKSAIKKLLKEWTKQKKLYDASKKTN